MLFRDAESKKVRIGSDRPHPSSRHSFIIVHKVIQEIFVVVNDLRLKETVKLITLIFNYNELLQQQTITAF